MSNKDDNNIFLKSLVGVKPLKKNNKIINSIPKSIKSDAPRIIIKETESDRVYEKAKNDPSFAPLKVFDYHCLDITETIFWIKV